MSITQSSVMFHSGARHLNFVATSLPFFKTKSVSFIYGQILGKVPIINPMSAEVVASLKRRIR